MTLPTRLHCGATARGGGPIAISFRRYHFMSHDTRKRVSETDRPMSMHRSYSQIGKRFSILLAVVALIAGFGFSQRQSSGSHSMLANAQDLGPEDSSKQITTTVWLRQRNKDAFDTLVQQMYQKDSPSYHHWLTMPEYIAKFAPTENDAAVSATLKMP